MHVQKRCESRRAIAGVWSWVPLPGTRTRWTGDPHARTPSSLSSQSNSSTCAGGVASRSPPPIETQRPPVERCVRSADLDLAGERAVLGDVGGDELQLARLRACTAAGTTIVSHSCAFLCHHLHRT